MSEYIYPLRIRSRGAGSESGIPGIGGGSRVSCCEPFGYGNLEWTKYPRFDLPSAGILQIFPPNPNRLHLRFFISQGTSRIAALFREHNTFFEAHTFNASEMLQWFNEAIVLKHEADGFTSVGRHIEILPAPTSAICLLNGFNSSSAAIVHAWEGQYGTPSY